MARSPLDHSYWNHGTHLVRAMELRRIVLVHPGHSFAKLRTNGSVLLARNFYILSPSLAIHVQVRGLYLVKGDHFVWNLSRFMAAPLSLCQVIPPIEVEGLGSILPCSSWLSKGHSTSRFNSSSSVVSDHMSFSSRIPYSVFPGYPGYSGLVPKSFSRNWR